MELAAEWNSVETRLPVVYATEKYIEFDKCSHPLLAAIVPLHARGRYWKKPLHVSC